MRQMVLLLLVLSTPAGLAFAAVKRIEIASRSDLAGGTSFGLAGPYEKLAGKIHFEVDPQNPRNQAIADLDKALRNERGQVEFSADLYLLKPKEVSRGNGALFLEICNRGRKGVFPFFHHAASSSDPTTEQEIGDGFLLRHGFAVAWIGWQFDVPLQQGLMRLYAPVAKDEGKPITGLVRADFVFGSRVYSAALGERNHIAYSVLDPKSSENILTMRDSPLGARRVIPRNGWDFARFDNGKTVPDRTHIYLREGFEPGKIYEIVYRAQDPTVVGLGLAAVRDLVSYLKNQPDALISVRRALGVGMSQSGRFLRQFLYQGFNADESNRQVFDGLLVHVAGGGRGSFNHRFAQPSRDGQPFQSFFYPTDLFPFTDSAQTDPETGERDGLLTHAQNPAVLPKIFYTNSSHEYWGRAASLIHTTVDGLRDMPLPENVRIYCFAGSQHGPGPFPPARNSDPDHVGQQMLNPTDFRWSMRALLLAMERWVREGTPPPPSQYPRIAGRTLVPLDQVAFPKLPGVGFPQRIKEAYRVDYGPEFAKGIVTREPPGVGRAFPILLPQVNSDGNEQAGIRMPEIAVPLATYTGWNLRHPRLGAPGELARLSGSYIPFALTRAERERSGDPRPSIEERYSSRAQYLGLCVDAVLELVADRYLMAEDVPAVLHRAARHWDYAVQQGNK